MKRIILAPDSFKGTMSASEICALQGEVIARLLPEAEVRAIPMADGGEGMAESYFRLLGGRRVSARVTGPLGAPVEAGYTILPDGSAVLEMAAAAGLPLAGEVRDPLRATTRGVGELLLDAAGRGVKRVLLGLGGSATNDCGVGLAAALGFRFLDGAGEEVEPLAGNLGRMEKIVPPEALPPLEVTAACDVDNPLTGPLGATAVFGPQKGVTPELQPALEAGMAHMGALLETLAGRPVARVPGSGAAGGLGAAVLAFLGGSLRPGIELLLDAAGFDGLLEGADLVLTGEGRIDGQSAHGKVPAGVGLRCKAKGVPCAALCGSVGPGAEAVYDCGVTAIFSAVRGITTFPEIRQTCREDLAFLTESVLRLLRRRGRGEESAHGTR